jgi:hypothetical protein
MDPTSPRDLIWRGPSYNPQHIQAQGGSRRIRRIRRIRIRESQEEG